MNKGINIISWLFFVVVICIVIMIMASCGCNHKECKHIPNDTIPCIIIDKQENWFYNPVTHSFNLEYDVTILNPNTGNKHTLNRAVLFKDSEVSDTVYQIIHYCPYSYVELTK